MGLKNYFAPSKAKKAEKEKATITSSPDALTEPNYPSGLQSGFETPGSPGSRPESVFRNSNMAELHDLKCDVMVNYLHQQQQERLWTMHGEDEGVVLKKSRGEYACCPADLADVQDGLLKAIEVLNVKVWELPLYQFVPTLIIHRLPLLSTQKSSSSSSATTTAHSFPSPTASVYKSFPTSHSFPAAKNITSLPSSAIALNLSYGTTIRVTFSSVPLSCKVSSWR